MFTASQLIIIVRITLARLLEQEHRDRVSAKLVLFPRLLRVAKTLRGGGTVDAADAQVERIEDAICGICHDYKASLNDTEQVVRNILGQRSRP